MISYFLFSVYFYLLGAFTKFRKATVGLRHVCLSVRPSAYLCVCLSVRPHGTTRLPLVEFSWNLVFEGFFSKFVNKIEVYLKSEEKNG
jgi:hypothetical protein